MAAAAKTFEQETDNAERVTEGEKREQSKIWFQF